MDPTTQDKTTILGRDYLDSLTQSMDIEFIPENLGGQAQPLPNGGVYVPLETLSNHGTSVEVARAASFKKLVTVEKDGTIIEWEYQTESHDIGFSIYMKDNEKEVVVPYTRHNSHSTLIKGSISVKAGVYVLEWDNTYSWTRGKTLTYAIQLVKES